MEHKTLASAQHLLRNAHRIGIKIGTESIMSNGDIDREFLAGLVKSVVFLKQQNIEVILVVSGAIGMGAKILGETLGQKIDRKKLDTDEKQKAATIGQAPLINAFGNEFSKYGMVGGQGLIDRYDITGDHPVDAFRRACLNLKEDRLGINPIYVPILNENDALATEEITFGDNDILSGLITQVLELDLLILGSDVKGLHLKNPKDFPDLSTNPTLTHVKDILSAFNLASDSAHNTSNGGMSSKILAAILAARSGVSTILTLAKNNPDFLMDIWEGEATHCTVFHPPANSQPIELPERYRHLA